MSNAPQTPQSPPHNRATNPAAGARSQARLVLCVTESTQAKLPKRSGTPSCLLPVGHQTLLERLLTQCAALGIKTVDLLVSEDPHAVRETTGQGERWGITLHWHWIRDDQHLMQHIHKLSERCLDPAAADAKTLRLVIGQAHHWISTGLLGQLLDRDMVLVHPDTDEDHGPDPWAGWMSVSPQACVNWCEAGPACKDPRPAVTHLVTGQVAPLQRVSPQQLLAVESTRDLLALNQKLLDEPLVDQPVAWLHQPWGMMSPLAHVAANATIVGPVSIGPGCWVMDGAHIGPHVNLTRDVVVHANTTVAEAIVFEKTYVGAGLDIHQALVSANHMEHPLRQVSFALPVADGRLLPMGPSRPANRRPRTPWLSRLGAAVMLLPLAPLAGLSALLARLRSQPMPWAVLTLKEAADRDAGGGSVTTRLRVMRETTTGVNTSEKCLRSCTLTFAAWLDIAQGQRCWVGIRPSLAAAPDPLPQDWQQALRSAPVGWLHAPAWKETASNNDQLWAQASADVFWIMQSNLRLGVLRRLKNSLGLRPG
jgi:hypothetical protein